MLALAAILFVAASAVPPQGSSRAIPPSPEQRPVANAGALLAVPYLAQTVDLCGGAALAMVLRYWGDTAVTASDFAPLIDRAAHGIATDVLTGAARTRGWLTLVPANDSVASRAALRADVNRGRPVIALIEDSPGNLHYIVIVAVTDTAVVFHDPARAPFRVVPLEAFDRAWAVTSRWMVTLLRDPAAGALTSSAAPAAVSAAPPAAPAGPCDALVAQSVALAGENQRDEAERGLLAAMRLCPGDAAAMRELAGLRFVQSRWAEAAQLARSSLRLGPDDPYVWRLIGTSEYLGGDMTAALRAWNRAAEPRVDVVNFTGLTRTRVPVANAALGLESRQLLTVDAFARAQRRIEALPASGAAELRVTPGGDGRVVVDAVIVERPAWPSGLLSIAVLGGRAVINHEIRVDAASLTGSGELWSASWRWAHARPRVTFGLEMPAPLGRPGVLTIDGSWERETYGAGEPSRESRRRARVGFTDWAPHQLRWQGGIAIERLESGRFAAVDAGLDQRFAGDHIAIGATGALWTPLSGGNSFRASGLTAAFRSTTARSPATAKWSGLVEWATTSSSAPRIIWPSAGTGRGQDRLLRAHPLADDGVITSEAFGRRLLYASTELESAVRRVELVGVSVAGFVDAARTRQPLLASTNSGWLVDAGVGLRIRPLKLAGVVRVDVAFGLRDHRRALSVGWARTWPH